MSTLTEPQACRLVANAAFDCNPPGFVGAAVDLLPQAALTDAAVESLRARPRLRHGFLTARSGVLVVSVPPSPGLEICLDRIVDDLSLAVSHVAAAQDPRGDPAVPLGDAAATAGIRVALEAGLDTGGTLGLPRRWRLAHTLAPVLAAAFANAPLERGQPSGWRSRRQARRCTLPVLPSGPDPRTAWTAYVLDAPDGDGRTLREWIRSAHGPDQVDLGRHLSGLRPPVAARGHLELDFADRQPADGWQVVIAVTTALLDDPCAAAAAEEATAHFAYEEGVWHRAARDALTDPALAAAARECFLAAYAALARQGIRRSLRDAVAEFTERHVLRGRCPADDQLDLVGARP